MVGGREEGGEGATDQRESGREPGCEGAYGSEGESVGGGEKERKGDQVSGRRSDNVRSTGPTVGLISSIRVRHGTRVQGATGREDEGAMVRMGSRGARD